MATRFREPLSSSLTPIIDGHNDLLWALRTSLGDRALRADLTRVHAHLATDIPRLRRGGVAAQFWSVFVPDDPVDTSATELALEQIHLLRALVRAHPDHLELAGSAAQVRSAMVAGRIASLVGLEGGHCLGGSLDALDRFFELGARYMTLTHNRSTSVADSATDKPIHGGLGVFGCEVVNRMNALGMLVDLSHASDASMRGALDISERPVIFSHSGARSVCDHPRNVPDDVLRSLATNGGVAMIPFVPDYVALSAREWTDAAIAALQPGGFHPLLASEADVRARVTYEASNPRPVTTVADVADHVDHVREVAGLSHVGVGSDFDGFPYFPLGLEDVGDFQNLIEELRKRRWSRGDIRALASENTLRVLGDADVTTSGR